MQCATDMNDYLTLEPEMLSTSHRNTISIIYFGSVRVNPLTAKLFNWNFHSLKVVSR